MGGPSSGRASGAWGGAEISRSEAESPAAGDALDGVSEHDGLVLGVVSAEIWQELYSIRVGQ